MMADRWIQDAIWEECHSSCIVLVDGVFNEELSNISALPSSCALLSSEKAIKIYGSICKKENGAFIYIPPSVTISHPLQVLSVFSSNSQATPRLQIFLGKDAALDLVYSIQGHGAAIDISLDEGARLKIASQISADKDERIFYSLHANLKRASYLNCFSFSIGAGDLERSLSASLIGQGASVHFNGFDYLKETREARTQISIEHRAPESCSQQHFKHLLQDQSRSSFLSKVLIEPAAQKSEAHLLSQNLFLSDQARAQSQPIFEIKADDVTAKHGATFSQIGIEELFYLQSRGLSAHDAKDFCLKGFCREMIDSIEIPAMKQRLL